MLEAVVATLREDRVESLGRSALSERFENVRRLKGAIAAYEARLVLATDRLGDRGLDGAGMLRSIGRRSSVSARAFGRTATALEEMPLVFASLTVGRITVDHAAGLARAAEEVSPQKAERGLLKDADSVPADVFARRCRKWINRNRPSPKPGDDVDEKRRTARAVRRFTDAEGMRIFLTALDPTTGELFDKRLNERYEKLWRDDGGRGGSPDEVRTPEQRMADAIVELVCGGSSATANNPRHQLTAIADVSRLRVDDPAGFAAIVDGEALPQSVLERLACNGEFTAMLFDGPGRPIWVGRDYRSATIAQWKGLIARDEGCIGCGAAPDRCEAHHIISWRWGGPTDITNLVLLCSRCHHDVHDRGVKVRRSGRGWRLEARAGPSDLQMAA